MHNGKHLQLFIDKVNDEASAAAQKIYDKYTPELKDRILNQMQKGEKLLFGMGTASFENIEGKPYDYAHEFLQVLTNIQYWDKVEVGFHTPDLIKR